jgi:hypothetical protein
MMKIGDPVRVRRMQWDNDGKRATEIWLDATVVIAADRGRIGVAYADGRREMLETRHVRAVLREVKT